MKNRETVLTKNGAYHRTEIFKDYQRKYNLRERYGLTVEDYEDLILVQGGACAICGTVPELRRLCVDHDHKTGQVRGLLCDSCNIGLSKYKDDPQLLGAAIAYLERCRAALKATIKEFA